MLRLNASKGTGSRPLQTNQTSSIGPWCDVMKQTDQNELAFQAHDDKKDIATLRRVVNIGSGPPSVRRLRFLFDESRWREVRLDIDPNVSPDIVGSLTTLQELLEPRSVDAVWASHVLEHLFRHEVEPALLQVRSILKPDGFAIITSPDIEVAAQLAAQHGMDYVVYHSPAGPITVHDMFYGHSSSIANGHFSMAHRTAFTCNSLAKCLLDAGFPTVLAKCEKFSIWAVALMEKADRQAIEQQLAIGGLNMSDDTE